MQRNFSTLFLLSLLILFSLMPATISFAWESTVESSRFWTHQVESPEGVELTPDNVKKLKSIFIKAVPAHFVEELQDELDVAAADRGDEAMKITFHGITPRTFILPAIKFEDEISQQILDQKALRIVEADESIQKSKHRVCHKDPTERYHKYRCFGLKISKWTEVEEPVIKNTLSLEKVSRESRSSKKCKSGICPNLSDAKSKVKTRYVWVKKPVTTGKTQLKWKKESSVVQGGYGLSQQEQEKQIKELQDVAYQRQAEIKKLKDEIETIQKKIDTENVVFLRQDQGKEFELNQKKTWLDEAVAALKATYGKIVPKDCEDKKPVTEAITTANEQLGVLTATIEKYEKLNIRLKTLTAERNRLYQSALFPVDPEIFQTPDKNFVLVFFLDASGSENDPDGSDPGAKRFKENADRAFDKMLALLANVNNVIVRVVYFADNTNGSYKEFGNRVSPRFLPRDGVPEKDRINWLKFYPQTRGGEGIVEGFHAAQAAEHGFSDSNREYKFYIAGDYKWDKAIPGFENLLYVERSKITLRAYGDLDEGYEHIKSFIDENNISIPFEEYSYDDSEDYYATAGEIKGIIEDQTLFPDLDENGAESAFKLVEKSAEAAVYKIDEILKMTRSKKAELESTVEWLEISSGAQGQVYAQCKKEREIALQDQDRRLQVAIAELDTKYEAAKKALEIKYAHDPKIVEKIADLNRQKEVLALALEKQRSF